MRSLCDLANGALAPSLWEKRQENSTSWAARYLSFFPIGYGALVHPHLLGETGLREPQLFSDCFYVEFVFHGAIMENS